ncbi:MAG: ferritin family protein, partial [Treponema socranskii subsp. buccale]
MAQLKGSRTEENLKTAFAGESQAHTKYLYFASKARKDGYEQIAALFEETAHNEKEHVLEVYADIREKMLAIGAPVC